MGDEDGDRSGLGGEGGRKWEARVFFCSAVVAAASERNGENEARGFLARIGKRNHEMRDVLGEGILGK